MSSSKRFTQRIFAIVAATAVIASTVVVGGSVANAASTVTTTFTYTGSTETFTVPSGVTQLTLSLQGAQGGRGGNDAAGRPPTGGYVGAVTGTISVTPGQVLTIAVGQGGGDGSAGRGSSVPADYLVGAAVGGSNPLGAYRGGNGGVAGPNGSSGYGGAGGAATVVTTSGTTIVAGGSGGSGGSGQYAPVLGRLSYATFAGRADTTSTDGQTGVTVATVCKAIVGNNCDGGGGGGGGGGAQGGAQGTIEFGSGTSLEWFGYGGYPGQNSTAGLSGLSASYQYYSTNNGNGSVTISYTAGAPDAPTGVAGAAGDSSVALTWTAPASAGESPVSDYHIEYAPSSDPTSWTTFSDGASPATSATVTGLTNGTGYVFRVSAVNTAGTGGTSAPSSLISPYGAPGAPSITTVSPTDAGLSVEFSGASSGGPILDYEYQLDGAGPWISSGATASPLTVVGLFNGRSYDVRIRAVSPVGAGSESATASGIPAAPAGAPNVTAVATGIGTATVSFTPGYAGGAAITDYEYRLDAGPWVSAGTTTSPLSITDLANGTPYAVAIRAVTAVGGGAASTESVVTTPDVADAPDVTAVVARDRALSIAFTPGNSNGSTVTAIEYQLSPGGPWASAPSLASPITVTGLSNGTTYDVRLRALNAVGTGSESSPWHATPVTVPAAPTLTGNTVAGADRQLSAHFSPPASDGGSAITSYEYSTDGGVTWRARATGTTGSPVVIDAESGDGVTPLVNGAVYLVELRAVNAVGAGHASAVAAGIARTTPDAPAITTITAGPSSLHVTFTPASNGGAAITSYEYRLGSGAWHGTGTLGSSFLIDGLSNGTTYGVSVRAVNSEGRGLASAQVSATPRTTPEQPAMTEVTRSDRTLTVSATIAGNGGSPVTDWEYSTDGGATWRSAGTSASPFAATTLSSDGLMRIANGSSYPVTIRAVNAAGPSAASAITTVGPGTTPGAPTVSLTPLNGSVQVGLTAISDGGSPLSALEYRLDAGAWVDAGTVSSTFVIGSLANGTSYTVEVRASNALGAGAPSTPSAATPRTVPDAPTGVTAESNTASANVSWNAPLLDGGSPITGYTATAYATASSTTALGTCATTTTACSIAGLTNGTSYYVSVVAENTAGASQPSAPRAVVVPMARPGAPTLSSLTLGNTSLSVAFTAGSAGGSSITGYEYQLNGGPWQSASGTSSPIVISGLTNGTAYTVALRAVSALGPGAASGVRTGTPYTFPDAPDPATIVADGVDGAIVVSWAAPNNNGSPITSYTATAFTLAVAGSQAGTACSTSALSCTITGLSNGVTYYVSMQAQNAAGLSSRSAPRVPATPSILPGAVPAATGVAEDGQVALTWGAGSTGASAISDYTIWYSSGGGYTQFADGTSTARSATVTGLTNGTPYTFVVYAVNGHGTGPASAASAPITPLAPGTVPTLSAPTSVVDGFDVTITNYSDGTTYAVTATGGATVTRAGSSVSVRGLDSGVSATVTVSASEAGHTTTSADATGSALIDGSAPTISGLVRSSGGFSFEIANYDPSAHYSVTATNGATVTQHGASVVVSGLGAGEASDVTIGVARAGHIDASAVVSSAALALGTAPDLVNVRSTADGFTLEIADYDVGLVYTFSVTNGAAVTNAGPSVVISALAPGESSVVTVTATDPGVATAQASTLGTALSSGIAPTLGTPVSTADGFSVAVTNYDPSAGYSLSATNGGIARFHDGGVTVSGLAPGAGADVTVTVSRTGFTDAAATISGVVLSAGVVPVLSTPVPVDGGFSLTIRNFSPDDTYSVSATGGATARLEGSAISLTGLAPGASATVTVTASRSGYTTVSASVAGSSLRAGIPPTFSTPVSTPDGFTVQITNYDAAVTYGLSASNPARVTRLGSSVTVSDLASASSASVVVTASRSGHLDATASVTGTSSAPPPAPLPTPSQPSTSTTTPTGGSSGALAPVTTGRETPTTAAPRPASNPTPAPATGDAPAASLVEQPPGSGAVRVDGGVVPSQLSATGTALTLRAHGLTMRVSAVKGGKSVNLSADRTIRVEREGHMRIAISGFKPGTLATVWGYSTPTRLTSLTVAGDRTAAQQLTLPASMRPGEHTLVVSGTSDRGERATMAVGITVVAPAAAAVQPANQAEALASPGDSSGWAWPAAGAMAVAMAAALLLLLWRRRDDDGDEATTPAAVAPLPANE